MQMRKSIPVQRFERAEFEHLPTLAHVRESPQRVSSKKDLRTMVFLLVRGGGNSGTKAHMKIPGAGQ